MRGGREGKGGDQCNVAPGQKVVCGRGREGEMGCRGGGGG